jgi:hypothetical protein
MVARLTRLRVHLFGLRCTLVGFTYPGKPTHAGLVTLKGALVQFVGNDDRAYRQGDS